VQSIQPTVRALHSAGIGAILDYAAESDVHTGEGVAGADSLSEKNYSVIVRTYPYESEKKCDSHVQIFMRALEAAKTLPGQGFAAIKVCRWQSVSECTNGGP
jgi:proline dehydrogenase